MFRDGVEEAGQPVLVGLAEVAEYMAGHAVPVAGMADAEAHAPVVGGAEQPVHAAQAVMSCRAPSPLDAHLARDEVELVMEGGDALGRGFEEGGGGLDGLTAVVHVGERLEGEDAHALDGAVGGKALETLPPRGEAVAGRDPVDGHEADVVTLACHRGLGVAEPDPKQHGRIRSRRRERPRARTAGRSGARSSRSACRARRAAAPTPRCR